MSTQKQERARVRSMSAKGPSTKSRPMSGISSGTNRISTGNLKTELITSIYNNKQKSPAKKNFSKTLLYPGISTEQLAKYKKPASISVAKSKQELFQQNLQLKKEINRLSQQLTILKGKTEKKSKKVLQKNKQYDMQFEKEVFWGGSKSHLISGIKYQYQKLKKQHIEQTKSYNQLKVALLDSKIPQYKIYAQAVQNQNKRLAQKLTKMVEAQRSALQFTDQNSKQVSQLMIEQAQENTKILQEKLLEMDTQLRNAKESLKDKDKKIQFLQKLITQKDNKQYHIGRKLKKSQKQKNELLQQIEVLSGEIDKKQKQKQKQQKQLISKHSEEKSQLNIKFNNELSQQVRKNRLLEQENKQLENTINKLRMSASSINNNSQSNFTVNKSNVPITKRNSLIVEVREPDDREGKKNNIDNYDSVVSNQMDPNELQEIPKFRVIQRADKKHSQSSKKARKVQFGQVQPIGQILRYRLLNQNINLNSMKNYFSNRKNRQQKPSFVLNQNENKEVKQLQKQGLKEPEWDDQYINMGECMQILSSYPFNLDKQSSHTLARYMIEDCHEEYVYTDIKNENTRQVVKSIIKAVVGQYNLFSSQVKSQAQQFMEKYQTNLQSALKTYYPSGKVTKRKFLDTVNGLGVQISQTAAEYLLTLAFRGSKNLQEIEYPSLFIKKSK